MSNNKAIIITIGDELLMGQVTDTNSTWMGQQLNLIGIPVIEKVTVSDTREGILDALNYASEKASIILLTGGLGPTKDDITKVVLAEYFHGEMVFHQGTYDHISRLYEKWNIPPNASHRNQCMMPSSAQVLENKMGTAPGILFDDSQLIVSMPGVPHEMKYLMKTHVLPLLSSKSTKAIVHKTIRTAGMGESLIAERISGISDRLPDHISLAFLPSFAQVRLRLSGESEDKRALSEEIEKYTKEIVAELGVIVYGYDDDSLITAISRICTPKNLSIGTAESCTGGRVASMIVNEAGSSVFYNGSVVSYSNKLKMKMLSVSQATLSDHGAVSEQTVTEMVLGALKTLDVDVAVAISGIAGPTGGTETKPVGMIWIACGNTDNIYTRCINTTKSRNINIEIASFLALDILRRYLLKNYG